MRTLLAAAFLCLPLLVQAQTAHVIQLTPEESTQAKSLHDQRERLDKEDEALRSKIVEKHLRVVVPAECLQPLNLDAQQLCINARGFRPEWPSRDFDYDTEYKYIVPHVESPARVTPANVLGSSFNCFTPVTARRPITLGSDGTVDSNFYYESDMNSANHSINSDIRTRPVILQKDQVMDPSWYKTPSN